LAADERPYRDSRRNFGQLDVCDLQRTPEDMLCSLTKRLKDFVPLHDWWRSGRERRDTGWLASAIVHAEMPSDARICLYDHGRGYKAVSRCIAR